MKRRKKSQIKPRNYTKFKDRSAPSRSTKVGFYEKKLINMSLNEMEKLANTPYNVNMEKR